MWSQENFKTVVTLAVPVVAGLFAIVAAVLTWKLTGRRERLKLQQEQEMQHFKSMEDLYTSLLEMVHEGIRYTEARLNYDDYYKSMSTLLSRAMLKAPEEVLQYFQATCDALSAWSSQYRKGLPLMIGDTGYAMVSNRDFPHQENARQLRPLLNDEMCELNAVMKKDLNMLRKQLHA
jgi:hypothetical protein